MQAHIVFAHPNINSFNGQLKQTAIKTLEQSGWQVSSSDLYQMKFNGAADAHDFLAVEAAESFDLQKEQLLALKNRTFAPEIVQEQAYLAAADLIIFQFPLWWHSMPGLLKGYIDRVFSLGWAYGAGERALAGKRALMSTTTGAPEQVWTADKRGTIKQVFDHLLVGTFEFCGMEALEPFVVYGAKRQTKEERALSLATYEAYLLGLLAE